MGSMYYVRYSDHGDWFYAGMTLWDAICTALDDGYDPRIVKIDLVGNCMITKQAVNKELVEHFGDRVDLEIAHRVLAGGS